MKGSRGEGGGREGRGSKGGGGWWRGLLGCPACKQLH